MICWIPLTWRCNFTLALSNNTLYLAYYPWQSNDFDLCVVEQSLSSAESLMVLQIMADPVAFFHSGDIYHFWENCQVCDERGIIVPLTVTPWLIQAHGSVCKCFFILVKVVNINNAHRGLSSYCLLAKFNMKAAFTFAISFLSIPPCLWMALIEGCDLSTVIGGAWAIGFLCEAAQSIPGMVELGRRCYIPHSSWRLSAGQAAKEHSVLSQEPSPGVQVTLLHSQTSR